MPSLRARLFMLASHGVGRGIRDRPTPHPRVLRSAVERTMAALPLRSDVRVTRRRVGAIDVEVLRPLGIREDRAMLYLHGGGYVAGSPRTHRAFTGRLALALGCEIWVPDYRLAPEHPFPAGLEDCIATWEAFVHEHGHRTLLLGGESAGGGLGLALCYHARERAMRAPARLYLQSAWLDLRMAGPSYRDHDIGDVMNSSRLAEEGFARHYAGRHSREDPRMSPLLGDPTGLPPTYVQVSDREIFFSDSDEFVRRARDAGVDVTLEIGKDLWHAWPLMVPFFPEATRSLRRLCRWVDA
jgi:monoterpene epsilon-lactone hydrolase